MNPRERISLQVGLFDGSLKGILLNGSKIIGSPYYQMKEDKPND